jgi:hypothetical protein
MIKIGISGKANSGKNTLAKLIKKELNANNCQFLAFADPIKKIAHIAFPDIPSKWLYGSSKYRSQIIPEAVKDNVPLTVRQLLIDIGNDFGRRYNPSIWIDKFDLSYRKLVKKNCDALIATDIRFRDEFNYLKKLDFLQIRIIRDEEVKINDVSESNQDQIQDVEFDFLINNNGTKEDLKEAVRQFLNIKYPRLI